MGGMSGGSLYGPGYDDKGKPIVPASPIGSVGYSTYPADTAAHVANPNGTTQAGLSAAQSAVTGIRTAASGSPTPYTNGGAGSFYSVDPSGASSYTATPNLLPQELANSTALAAQGGDIASKASAQGAAQESALSKQQAAQAAAAAIERQGFASTMLDKARSGMTLPAQVDGGGVAFNEQAARDAAFARAKDQAGQTALSSLKAIQQLSEETGQMGSSMEHGRMGAAIGGAAGGVNDFTRERYIQDLARAASISDRNYAGNITQRGQDVQSNSSLAGLISAIGTLY